MVSEYLHVMVTTLLNLKPGTLISAVSLALFLAFGTAVAYDRARRSCGNARALLVSIVLLGNVLSMVVAATYVVHARQASQTTAADFNGIVFRGVPPAHLLSSEPRTPPNYYAPDYLRQVHDGLTPPG